MAADVDLFFPAGQADQAEIDQMNAAMLDDMRSQGVDVSTPIPVEQHLSFPSDQQALDAGGELLIAGWPGVRTGGGATATHLATVVVLYQLVLTVESMRAARQQLVAFAAARGGVVVSDQTGGEPAFGLAQWKASDAPSADDQLALEDQTIIDHLFAWDIDIKRPITLIAGIGFASEADARSAAAELFRARWPEVHVVRGDSVWVAEVVTSVVPELKTIRDTRLGMTGFAGRRGGSWLGFTTRAMAPKQVQEGGG